VAKDTAYWNDILQPRKISRTYFLTHGLATLLQDVTPQLLEQTGAVELIKNFVSAQDDDRRDLLADFISDTSLQGNVLSSFLGGERFQVLSSIIGKEGIEITCSNTLHEIVRQSLENLKVNPNQQYEWGKLWAIVGDSPIYQDVKPDLIWILSRIDIESIYQSDPFTARMALRVAASQVNHMDNKELSSRLEENFLQLIKFESTSTIEKIQSTSDNDEFLEKDSLTTALMLSFKASDPSATSTSFSKLLSQLIRFNPKSTDYYTYFSLKSVLELPISQLQGLWSVLITLRASSKDAL
jgi:hypothetical protein